MGRDLDGQGFLKLVDCEGHTEYLKVLDINFEEWFTLFGEVRKVQNKDDNTLRNMNSIDWENHERDSDKKGDTNLSFQRRFITSKNIYVNSCP